MLQKYIERYKKLSKPIKAAFWFTICNILLKGIRLIVMPIFTRMMSSSEYGIMSVITSYENIFIILATFEIYLGAFQRGILKYKSDLYTFEQTIVLLSNIITIIFSTIIFVNWTLFNTLTGISVKVFSLMIVYFLVTTPYNCWINKKRFTYEYTAAVLVTLAMTLASNVLPVLGLTFLGHTAEVQVSFTLITYIIFGIPFWIKYWNISNIISNKKLIKEQLKYALKFQCPLVFHSLSYYVLAQSDRVMIGYFADNSKAAYYSIAYSLGYVITILQSSLNLVLKPWRYQKLEKGDYKSIWKISNVLLIFIGGIIVLFALIVPDVLKIFFAPEYYEAVYCMAPVAFGVYFMFLYTMFVDIESYFCKTKYIAYVSGFCAGLNLLLNYFGIKIFGYMACAYTTLVCYMLMAVLYYAFMRRTCRQHNIYEDLIDPKFTLGWSIGMTFLFGVVLLCYYVQMLRYILIVAIIVIGFMNRNRIISIWNIVKKDCKA